ITTVLKFMISGVTRIFFLPIEQFQGQLVILGNWSLLKMLFMGQTRESFEKSLEIITKTYLVKRLIVFFHGEDIMLVFICQRINNLKRTTIFFNFHHLITLL